MDKFKDFLKDETYCVISTVSSDNTPESAYVAFSESDKLEITIGTSKNLASFKILSITPMFR